ncbi:MAG: TRC40/GET3/ArsA family transport-energizing ATPase [Nanoarchaeota archaeon]
MLDLKKEREPVYYFFSGKGGVGKTSVSAATALNFAKNGKKVLIVSVDPAHSLSDSFETHIGGEIKKLGDNLYAVEIDPVKAMQEYKEKFMPQVEKMGALKGLGLEDAFDFAGMTPGIDEIAAFDKFLQYMEKKDYDIIVFDTAPTGHALRFLSLPDVLDSWVGKMINFRMKFASISNIFKRILPFGNPEETEDATTKQLDAMKERINNAKLVLSDPKKTHYNIVMIPEEMSISESKRSIDVMKNYRIPINSIVVNQLIPEHVNCSFCTERRKSQQKCLEKIKNDFSSFKVFEVPLFEKEVHGLNSLTILGTCLYAKQ